MRNKYEVEIDGNDGIEALRAQLFSLTNVPAENQKILIKGKKVETDEAVAALKDGQKLMLMGSAKKLVEPKLDNIVFAEDLTNEEKNQITGSKGAVGLVNLGNTCYMNSTLQCLRGIPELKDELKNFAATHPGQQSDLRAALASNMGNLFKDMETASESVVPAAFTRGFRTAFPQFNETNNAGQHMQQDADEALQQLMQTLATQLVDDDDDSKSNAINRLFGGAYEVETKCAESEDEPPTSTTEHFMKIKCHIDKDTNYLHNGLERGMTEELEKNSPTLGRNARYVRTRKIMETPEYLAIQFVRFFWKQDTQKKAKILRKVKFPMELDILPYCDSRLKKVIGKKREAKIDADTEATAAPMVTDSDTKDKDKDTVASTTTMEVDTEDAVQLNHSGYYKLCGVVTHKGRSADSGHYIGWVHSNGDEWHQYDDDVVTPKTAAEIQNLCGGGDWHMAYICFYKKVKDSDASE
jgi:ubiquitin carboxyl-terminal hydrolase 14